MLGPSISHLYHMFSWMVCGWGVMWGYTCIWCVVGCFYDNGYRRLHPWLVSVPVVKHSQKVRNLHFASKLSKHPQDCPQDSTQKSSQCLLRIFGWFWRIVWTKNTTLLHCNKTCLTRWTPHFTRDMFSHWYAYGDELELAYFLSRTTFIWIIINRTLWPRRPSSAVSLTVGV